MKNLPAWFAFFSLILSFSLFASFNAFAKVGSPPSDPGVLLFQKADGVIFFLLILSFVSGLYVIKSIGSGALNATFTAFLEGILLIGLSRLFAFFSFQGVYQISSASLHFWWHLLFYLGMLAFIWGGSRLKDLSTNASPEKFGFRNQTFLGLLLLTALAIFVFPNSLESALSPVLTGSMIESSGLLHLAAIVLAGAAGSTMLYIRHHWGRLLSVSSLPLLAFLVLSAVQHLWELAAGSWKLVVVPSQTIERVDQLIAIPAFIFLIASMLRVAQVVRSQLRP